jgi:uncharacterized membrane protein
MSAELILLVIATAGAGIAALFAVLGFLRTQQLPDALTGEAQYQFSGRKQISSELPSRTRRVASGRSLANRCRDFRNS